MCVYEFKAQEMVVFHSQHAGTWFGETAAFPVTVSGQIVLSRQVIDNIVINFSQQHVSI